MDKKFIIEVLEDAKSFYKDEELQAIEEAISIVQKYSEIEERKDNILKIISEMRDITPEERESANKYIESISKPTGVNIFDIIDQDNKLPIKNIKNKKEQEERCYVCGGIKRFGICQDCGTDA